VGLRIRVTLVVVAIVWFTVVAAGLVGASRQASTMREATEQRALEVLRAVSVSTGVALANRQMETLDTMVGRLSDEPGTSLEIAWVAVLDTEGRVVAHTDPTLHGTVMDGPFAWDALVAEGPIRAESETGDGEPVLEVAIPLESGLRWGTAMARISFAEVQGQVRQEVLRVFLLSCLVALFCGLVLARVLDRLVLEPLEHITRVAQEIADGRKDSRVGHVAGHDEMAQLGHSLNEMADRIVRQTQHLETRVARRTTELQGANRALASVNRQLADAVQQLGELARTDELTGLANRRAFLEHLEFELRRSARTRSPVSLLMIDVDHFKAYNDAHGHPAGDRLLARLARVFQGRLRTIDRVARYGGEEFTVILLDTGADQAMRVAEKLARAVRDTPFPGALSSQPGGRVTISLGVASCARGRGTAAELLERADTALYEAKATGRDRVCVRVDEAA